MNAEKAAKSLVYERFGRTSETAQLFEYGLATIHLYLEYFGKGWWQRAPSNEELKNFQEKNRKNTIGTIINKIQRLSAFDLGDEIDDFDAILDEALVARNVMIHYFFQNNAGLLSTASGRVQMLQELDGYQEKLDRGMAVMTRLHDALLKLHSDFQDPGRRDAILEEGLANLAANSAGGSSRLN